MSLCPFTVATELMVSTVQCVDLTLLGTGHFITVSDSDVHSTTYHTVHWASVLLHIFIVTKAFCFQHISWYSPDLFYV